MSGKGERFLKDGFRFPKPLIKVAGKPIIAHVVDLFPKETNFLFICNEDHLNDVRYNMRETILKYCPNGKIFSIRTHKKGPIHAILEIEKHINLNIKTIVNYCDFTCYWNWNHFKKKITDSSIDGAIPAYKGFHPHSLSATNYAYIKEKKMELLDIQEKQPFTKNKLNEYASSGTYYFRNGKIMIDAFRDVIKNNMNINGEYYVSLSYITNTFKSLKTIIYPIEYFMQWGTPEDLKEYKEWHKAFLSLSKNKCVSDLKIENLIMPMAGKGQRFLDEGYKTTKPMIKVSGKPMVLQSINHLPLFNNYCFVTRTDIKNTKPVIKKFKYIHTNTYVKSLDKITNGQAHTAFIGLKHLDKKINIKDELVTFGACDVGVIFNREKLKILISDKTIDLIVWTRKKNIKSISNPQMYGWVQEKKKLIHNISVKNPFHTKNNISIITGIFTFRNKEVFIEGYNSLINKKNKINGEYYLDSIIDECLKLRKKCVTFQVDHYFSWGTPNELKTFEYWQSCFDKWNGHQYSMKKDPFIQNN